MADLTMTRGDTFVWDGAVTTAAGTVQDITGCTLWMTAKYSKSDLDSAAVFQKKIGTGIVVAAPTGGTYVVTVDPTDTSGLTRTAALYYDVQIKDGASKVVTIASGTLTVTTDVTLSTS